LGGQFKRGKSQFLDIKYCCKSPMSLVKFKKRHRAIIHVNIKTRGGGVCKKRGEILQRVANPAILVANPAKKVAELAKVVADF